MLDKGHTKATIRQLHAQVAGMLGVRELTTLAVGLHAARVKTPYMTLRARTSGLLLTPMQSGLKKAPQMRSTLHYITETEFAFFHEATAPQRLAGRYRSLRRLGLPAEKADLLRARLLNEIPPSSGLSEGLLLRYASEITKGAWRSCATPAHMAWQLVRLLWDHGDIQMENRAESWAAEERSFTLASYTETIGSQRAREYVIKRYVDAYGPVSLKDITWWTAFDAQSIAQAIIALKANGDIVSAQCKNSGHELLVSSFSVDPLPSQEQAYTTTPVFLAYEDPFIKAYFHTRSRYGSPNGLRSLFYTTGEAKASVLMQGKVRGIWALPSQSSSATLMLCPKLSRSGRALVADHWREHLKLLTGDEAAIKRSTVAIDEVAYVN